MATDYLAKAQSLIPRLVESEQSPVAPVKPVADPARLLRCRMDRVAAAAMRGVARLPGSSAPKG